VKINSAWLGVVLIVLGLVAMVVFTWMKIPEGATAISIVVLGIAILQGQYAHTTTKQLTNTTEELTTLRRSMRPPSLVDEYEKLSSPSVSRETLLSQRPKDIKSPSK
jgi:xanthine/uracil/vitamin C permease (AzgA family)